MTYTKEQQAENRAKWVAALRSGEYEQGREFLKDGDRYCCLGVACELAVRESATQYLGYGFFGSEHDKRSSILPVSVQDWLGLWGHEGDVKPEHPAYDQSAHLTGLNDTADFTFDQIADVIEEGGVRLAEDTE